MASKRMQRVNIPVVLTGTYEFPTGPRQVFVKNEAEQTTGAFKFRGVRAFMLQDPGRGPVVTASTGNHGAAVAYMARALNRAAIVFVPEGTPTTKTARITGYRGELIPINGDYAACARAAQTWAQEHSGTYVPSFDHPAIIAGHTTLFTEADAQLGRMPGEVYVPVGGGGILSSAHLHYPPNVRVVGVELEGADAMRRSLAAGRQLTIEVPLGVAEGLCVPRVGDLPFKVAAWARAEVQTVSVQEIEHAVHDLWHGLGIRAELAGAAAFAAARRARGRLGATLAVVSGGNVNDAVFDRIVLSGSAAA